MTASKLRITFGRSSSVSFTEAVELAKTFDGYAASGIRRDEKHSLEVSMVPVSRDILRRLTRLWNCIASWKSTSVFVDDAPVSQSWEFGRLLGEVCQCHETCERSSWSTDHCCGKAEPSAEREYFGCRFEKSVKCQEGDWYRKDERFWYQVGHFSEDATKFCIDKDVILASLKTHTAKRLCVLCPAFSWERLEVGVRELPDEVDLSTDKDFRIKYSTLDPNKPIGIERRRDRENFISVGFGSQYETTTGEPRKRDVPSVRYSDVAGQQQAITEIENLVGLPLKHPEYFAELGVEPHQGILLYGPPGNGKTLIAKAVAGEANAHLEFINGPEILSKWVGQSEQNLRTVFASAKSLAPSVVLIDEIDAVAGTRDKVSHQHEISLISQLLVLLDGLEARGKVTVIATTNRIDALDPAMHRAGRFDYHIEVPPPDLMGRRAILRVHLAKLRLAEEVVPPQLSDDTDGFSGAELAALCREAGLLAIRRALAEHIPASEASVSVGDLILAVQSIKAKRLNRVSS